MQIDLTQRLPDIHGNETDQQLGDLCAQIFSAKREQTYEAERENYQLAKRLYSVLDGDGILEADIATANRMQQAIKDSALLPLHKIPAVELIEDATKSDAARPQPESK